MSEIAAGILLLLGGLFCAVAGLGVLRLPDVLVRMHASTKAGTLGVGLIVIGVAVHFATEEGGSLVVAKALLIVLFLLLTAPVGAHLIGRSAYRSETPLWEGTVVDERDRMGDEPQAWVDSGTQTPGGDATPAAGERSDGNPAGERREGDPHDERPD